MLLFFLTGSLYRIYIINDGSPVDFTTTRGDEGRHRSGRIYITFAGVRSAVSVPVQSHMVNQNTYVNDDVTSEFSFDSSAINSHHYLSCARRRWDPVSVILGSLVRIPFPHLLQ